MADVNEASFVAQHMELPPVISAKIMKAKPSPGYSTLNPLPVNAHEKAV